MQSHWKQRGLAAAVHLGASSAVAALAAVLVLLVWFPDAYQHIAGGLALFALLVGVDVVLGPALTFVVFDRAKPRAELVRDLAVIGIVQLAALVYGLSTAYEARPVYLVHEVDRFRVVRAADIEPSELAKAQPQFRQLPWHGVRMIGARAPRDSDEMLQSLESALAGRDIGLLPAWWQVLGPDNERQIRRHARTIDKVRARAGPHAEELERVVAASGVPHEHVIGLPLLGQREGEWSVLLDVRDLRIIGYLPVDLF